LLNLKEEDMKIIGQRQGESGSKTYIFEALEDEMAQFLGFYSEYSLRDKVRLQPGINIEIGQCYKDAKEALDLSQNAKTAATSLKAAATRFLSFFEKEDPKLKK
jgi:hypothetical protein